MFDLTTFDYIYAGVVLASTIWATIRGGVYETVATVSWIVAAITSRFVSPFLDTQLQRLFGLSESSVGTLMASYLIVFLVILVIFSFFAQRLRDRVQQSLLKVTDHSLGVVFGIVRGIVLMGVLYWGGLWWYSDSQLPEFVANARSRPVAQLTMVKIHDWFVPGADKLIERDMRGTVEAQKIYDNLINPQIEKAEVKTEDTGYKSSERTALENQLLQIENSAREDDLQN
ncbi:MAG: CvpA family protein [Rickettsiales bacterium]|jgi:membrane protein required for colicin V production|nr:CvpA family protein [Rickettsiales bacterium]